MSAPIFTKEHFTEWVKKQPPEKEYPFMDGRNCALATYAKGLGFENASADSRAVIFRSKEGAILRKTSILSSAEDFLAQHPHTYGALAKRLEGKG